MSEDAVRVDVRDDRIAVITLNRPDKLNALNEAVRQRLMEVVDSLATDDRVRVALLEKNRFIPVRFFHLR